MATFEEVWRYIQVNLRPGMVIENWTAYQGNFGQPITIKRVTESYIEVDPAATVSTQHIQKEHFRAIWEIWADYKNGKVPRNQLRDMNRFSRYIINIFHWYDPE